MSHWARSNPPERPRGIPQHIPLHRQGLLLAAHMILQLFSRSLNTEVATNAHRQDTVIRYYILRNNCRPRLAKRRKPKGATPMRAMTLEEMKAVELEIMDEIDAICRQHGLTYFLGYGSVLGAVRRDGGFIPWDDDMDVIMPRDDYEQLIAHFDKWRTSKNYALTFCRNDTSVYQFVKIIDTRTSVKERYVSASYKTGVWVDIFPLDGIPKDAKRVFRRNARLTASLALALSDPSNRHNTPAQARKETARPHSEENGSRTLFPADR